MPETSAVAYLNINTAPAITASFIFLSRIREAFYVTERTPFHAGG